MASIDTPEPSTALRAELKEWERAFAAANGGRKAERNDIKKVPEIAAKYKEYSRLKSLETSSSHRTKDQDTKPSSEQDERPKKRKHASPPGPEENTNHHQPTSTPRKASKTSFTTPSKPRVPNHPSDVDPYDSPSTLRRLFSPSTHQQSSTPLRSIIGPTPQRDGKALGLFDLLSESGGSTSTPSAKRVATVRGSAAQTPSKRKPAMDTIAEGDEDGENAEAEEATPRGARTPASSGKKYMLQNLFATPTTLRYAAMVDGGNEHAHAPTPGNRDSTADADGDGGRDGSGPVGSETPSFLRRSNSGRFGASSNAHARVNGGLSPIAARKPPQFVGKGLSALVQGLRDMEEERMQDDMDVLDEMEAEAAAAAAAADVPDSQAAEEPARRKKKGQKRTTRRVNMKPVVVSRAKAQSPSPQLEGSGDESGENEEGDGEGEIAVVPDTQLPDGSGGFEDEEGGDGQAQDIDDTASLHTMSEPDVDSDDPEYAERPVSLSRSKSFSEKMKEAIGLGSAASQEPPKKESKAASRAPKDKKPQSQPQPRKVNPEAHANYRSLKLRNKNTKGRGGGRFRRR